MKVYIGSAVSRTVEPRHMKALVPFLRDERYAYYPQVGDALIERTRGISASYFLRQTDANVHLSIDSDVTEFSKDGIDELCQQTFDYDIVCAPYITRSVYNTFPASMIEEGTTTFGVDSTPVPIKWGATGCMAVHRRVFEELAKDMPLLHAADDKRAFYDFYETTHYEYNGELIKLSEDFAFCERARQAGFKVTMNPAIRLGHVGTYTYRLEDMAQKQLPSRPMRLTRTGKKYKVEYAEEVEPQIATAKLDIDRISGLTEGVRL